MRDGGLLSFFLTSLLIELTPGPNMAYLASVAVGRGRAQALAGVAGVALGLATVGALASLGLAELILRYPLLYAALRYAGVIFMLWLAFDAWRDADIRDETQAGSFASFGRGLVTNLLNPKAAVFYVAILPGFIDPAGGGLVWQNIQLVGVYVATATAVHAAIVLMAARLRGNFAGGAAQRLVRRVLAVLLAIVALWLLWETRK